MADLHSPPFAQLVDVARSELRKRKRLALMTAAHTVADERSGLDAETLGFFGDLRPRSLIVVGSAPDMSSIAPIVESLPAVLAGGIDDALPFAATVRSDDLAGMRLLVEHLRERGHTRIAHVGGSGGPIGASRARAYVRAMREAGLETEVLVEAADFTEAGGHEAARRLLEHHRPPTAITSINDLAAVGALAAARATGVAVAGYGDTAVADFRLTQLTTVRAHNGEIGRRAVEALLTAEDDPGLPHTEVLVRPSLVVRATT
jgi:DNA-binding LacI/PurR family transcriptional regulator